MFFHTTNPTFHLFFFFLIWHSSCIPVITLSFFWQQPQSESMYVKNYQWQYNCMVVVKNNSEVTLIKSVGYGGMLGARLLSMQITFKSHLVVIMLTFETCLNLLQLLIIRQMKQFRELAEAAYINSRRGELQQWMPFAVFLVGLYIRVTEEKKKANFNTLLWPLLLVVHTRLLMPTHLRKIRVCILVFCTPPRPSYSIQSTHWK